MSRDLQELRNRLLQGVLTVEPCAMECLEGTRTSILADIAAKTDDRDCGKNGVWIRGAPGVGKSSISLSAKSRLLRQNRLVTYYRFDRNEATTTTSTALWRHVAYGLARQLPSLRPRFLQHLREEKIDLDSPQDVFISLIEDPLSKFTSTTDPPLVTIIDGLDECGGRSGNISPDRQALLQTLERWSRLPNHFKLLVTSREDGDISRVLSSISTPIDISSGRFLAENPTAKISIEASNDIHMFLENRFGCIRERIPSLTFDWPGPEIVAGIVRRIAGNFMWASSAADFIDSGNPADHLLIVMSYTPWPAIRPLHFSYAVILEMALGHIADDDSKANLLRSVLCIMVVARHPLPDIAYTKLPGPQPAIENMLRDIRDGLRSVIVPGPNLRFVHESFDDFLLSEECPSAYRIRNRIEESHRLLTKICLTTMTTELHFNMCGLETSCLKNTDVPNIENKVVEGIPALLSYCCRFFADHLSMTPFNEDLMGKVKEMVLDKLLFWFEAMSLLKEINRVSYSLLAILKWLHISPEIEFKEFISDARRFVGAFANPIAQSAPHVYISALPFAPERSLVARHFLPKFPFTLALSIGKPTDWSSCSFASEHHKSTVNSVAFSPDERYFISSSDDGVVCVCDSETGNLISGPFKADGDPSASRIFFDPSGRRLWTALSSGDLVCWDIETGGQRISFKAGRAIGCYRFNHGYNIVSVDQDGMVIFWDPDTGEQLRDLRIGDRVNLVSISPDGRYSYIASAASDARAPKIWNLLDGCEIRGPSDSRQQFIHFKRISSLSFSVDGKFVVTGSVDGTILVWDTMTGTAVGAPLATGTGDVTAVAYSPGNQVLVVGSGMNSMLTVWNASTHEAVLGPLDGHSPHITQIALSKDGQRGLTAFEDETVRMWNLDRRGVVPAMRHVGDYPTSEVRWVNFSPCGTKLVSVDERTIRIWDVITGEPLIHLRPICSSPDCTIITFSPDGNRIVRHGSCYGTLCVWDAHTGELSFQLNLSGKDRDITYAEHISFRSTDEGMVTSSNHGVVRVWSLGKNTITERLPVKSPERVDPNQPVKILALSPDGLIAVVQDKCRSPRHYMWNTITCQPLPIIFVDDKNLSGNCSFSSTGRLFATAYTPENESVSTLRVWNTQTGELVAGPSTLDGRIYRLAFSPNDQHIAFSYSHLSTSDSDRTAIWIWDVRTGCLTSRPLKGHLTRITALTFSLDGKNLVSGSTDGQIRIWKTAVLSEKLPIFYGLLGAGTEIRDGWVMDEHGKLLFWVPRDRRTRLLLSENVTVISRKGIATELDLKRFRYGEGWADCFA